MARCELRSLHVAAPGEARCGFRNVQVCEFRNVWAGDKTEQSEMGVTDNESRAKRGVGYAMLVLIIKHLISEVPLRGTYQISICFGIS